MRSNPGAKPKDIATATGLDPSLVRQTCSRMVTDAQLVRADGGYRTPEYGGAA
ncbi:hypothetical protein [Streptomyces ureilyticus]|uniref:hypothetical protein n=1 Tax=Streptomyces ureilyticus TaxID=1775131 RepID=UPI002E2996DA|nr:hypothetical protein [Streptomyces ureilyticus]